MKMFVLFLFLNVGEGTFNIQEFTSRETCEAAGQKATETFKNMFIPKGNYICVEK